MDLPPQRHPGNHNGQILRRRMQRFLPFSDRRTSKVWNHYTQLNLHRVECNHCKRQLSFHNSTTSMREHLGRKHSIREGAVPPHNKAGIPTPAALHSHIQTSLHGNRCNTTGNAPFQPMVPVTVKEEQEEILPVEMVETKPARTTYAPDCAVGSGASSSNAIVHQETDLGCIMYNFPAGEMSSTAGGSSCPQWPKGLQQQASRGVDRSYLGNGLQRPSAVVCGGRKGVQALTELPRA